MDDLLDIADFREQCPPLLDRLGPEGIVITKRGRSIAQVLPCGHYDASLIGSLRDKITMRGGLMTTGIQWNNSRTEG